MSKQTLNKSDALRMLHNLGITTLEELNQVTQELGIKTQNGLTQSDLISIRDYLTKAVEEPPKTQPQAPQLGQGEITQADQAIAQSAYSLTEAQKITTQEVIATQDAQDELLGEVSGIKGGLKFMSSHIRSKQVVLNSFIDQTLEGIAEELDAIDQEVIGLAKESSKWLGKALSRDTCKNLQDGLETLAIPSFQGFRVEVSSLPLVVAELTVNSLHNLRIF